MKQTTTGLNRTGIKASPIDAGELLETLQMGPIDGIDAAAPPVTAEQLRMSYRDSGDRVGSMPPPVTVKGLFGSAVQALSGNRLQVLLDKLGERAAYERSGTRLYDAALRRFAGLALPAGMSIEALSEIREEEARHFQLLAATIEDLGGDSTTQTPCADVTAVQGMGLMQALNDPRLTPAQALQTLLAAELIDVASWELLIELAEAFGLDEAVQRFGAALEAENRHLANVRGWLAAAIDEEAHGKAVATAP